MEEKADEGRKLILQSEAILFFVLFLNSISRACSEILSVFFSSFTVIILFILEALRVLRLAFWILRSGGSSTCH